MISEFITDEYTLFIQRELCGLYVDINNYKHCCSRGVDYFHLQFVHINQAEYNLAIVRHRNPEKILQPAV